MGKKFLTKKSDELARSTSSKQCVKRAFFFFLHGYILLSRKQALVLASRGERQMKWTPVLVWGVACIPTREVSSGRKIINPHTV